VTTWQVAVTTDCIASGSCLAIAPTHFAWDADGWSHATTGRIDPDPAVLDAAASCPMEAIRIHDTETGAPIDP
jgi:ferredoxin